jgi:pimeloyl-ACP methyl ester carboxylesterase
MSTFVLVHGAWQSASTWDLIVPKLQTAGHQVFTPELTGLGEDSDRLSSSVNLDSHIDDVAGLLEGERLQGVTLVGHSYAGMVITGVAERESSRLSRLIYVDAFVPNNDESVLDLLPETMQKSLREEADAHGESWRLPASEKLLDLWGLGPGAARDYVRRRWCDFSLRCFEQKVRLPSNAAALIQKTFIAAVAESYPARSVFARFAERARRERWDYHELPAGHDCHVELPERFVALLLALAGDHQPVAGPAGIEGVPPNF